MRHPEGFAPSIADELAAIDKERDSKVTELHASEPYLPTLERAVDLVPEHAEVWLSMDVQSPHIDVKGVNDMSGDVTALIDAVIEDGWKPSDTSPQDSDTSRKWIFSRWIGGTRMLWLFVTAHLGDEHDCTIEETERKQGPLKVFKILCPGSPEVQYRTEQV